METDRKAARVLEATQDPGAFRVLTEEQKVGLLQECRVSRISPLFLQKGIGLGLLNLQRIQPYKMSDFQRERHEQPSGGAVLPLAQAIKARIHRLCCPLDA